MQVNFIKLIRVRFLSEQQSGVTPVVVHSLVDPVHVWTHYLQQPFPLDDKTHVAIEIVLLHRARLEQTTAPAITIQMHDLVTKHSAKYTHM